MITEKKYPSKILLFGEYAVLEGADALAVPFPRFYGKWAYTKDRQPSDVQQDLHDFCAFLAQEDFSGFDAMRMQKELDKGLYFSSNIPMGYGAGSSAALCAAVYDSFIKKGHTLPQLKAILAQMESFFHGSSSGFDPLVSYTGKATHLSAGMIHSADTPPNLAGLFLVDTQQPRQAERYIRIFKEKQQDTAFTTALREQLVPLTQRAIRLTMSAVAPGLFDAVREVSRWQYAYFREMIPESVMPLWEKGMETASYSLKICGAGGGGFLLGISQDWDATLAEWEEWELMPLWG